MWAQAEEFQDVVQAGWRKRIDGVPMFMVVNKLKGMKRELKMLNKKRFSNIEQAADEALDKLKVIQGQIQSDPGNRELHRDEKGDREEYEEKNKARMSFLKQKVKQNWLEAGDVNTSYFHACLKQTRSYNYIYRLKNIEGV